MTTSTKTDQDLALVREVIGVDPLDFARWAGGQLAIILPDGRKLVLTEEQVSQALKSGEYRIKVQRGKDTKNPGATPTKAGGVVSPLSAGGADAPPVAPGSRDRGRPRKDES